jgi:hypothetical protein
VRGEAGKTVNLYNNQYPMEAKRLRDRDKKNIG